MSCKPNFGSANLQANEPEKPNGPPHAGVTVNQIPSEHPFDKTNGDHTLLPATPMTGYRGMKK